MAGVYRGPVAERRRAELESWQDGVRALADRVAPIGKAAQASRPQAQAGRSMQHPVTGVTLYWDSFKKVWR